MIIRGIFFNDYNKDCFAAIIAETYIFKMYDTFVRNKRNMTIVDVGGNIDIVTMYLAEFAKKLYVMEPCQRNFEVLTQKVKYNNLTNVTLVNKALDATDGMNTFYNNNYTMFSMKPGTNIDRLSKNPVHLLDNSSK